MQLPPEIRPPKVEKFVQQRIPSARQLRTWAENRKRGVVECVSGGLTFYGVVTACQLLGGLLRVHSSSPLGVPGVIGAVAVTTGSILSLEVATWAGSQVEGRDHRRPFLTNHKARPFLDETDLKIGSLGAVFFYSLGGSFSSCLPSCLSAPGAFRNNAFSIPASGTKYANPDERVLIMKLGEVFGCHTCGAKRGPFHADHMPPNKFAKAANRALWRRWTNTPVQQRFFPQCQPCSNLQGKAVRRAATEFRYHFSAVRPYHLTGALLVLSWQLLQEWDRAAGGGGGGRARVWAAQAVQEGRGLVARAAAAAAAEERGSGGGGAEGVAAEGRKREEATVLPYATLPPSPVLAFTSKTVPPNKT